jgi:hypothetical protein
MITGGAMQFIHVCFTNNDGTAASSFSTAFRVGSHKIFRIRKLRGFGNFQARLSLMATGIPSSTPKLFPVFLRSSASWAFCGIARKKS